MLRLKKFRSEIKELFFFWIVKHLPRLKFFDYYKCKIYKLAGIKIKGFNEIVGLFDIKSIGYLHNIEIGNGTFFNNHVFFEPIGKITIGEFCQIGPHVVFETVSHEIDLTSNYRETIVAPIVVGNHVWIGANSIILQGVTIGTGAVVAAGALVNKDIPPFSLYGGVPAKFIKSINQDLIT